MELSMSNRVKMHSLLSVVSSKPIEPGKGFKFSSLDQAMGLHTVHVVYYYQSNPFHEGPHSLDMDNLRAALSDLLNEYPKATGRLTRGVDGNWEVKCNDAGVRMVRADVSTTIDEWLRSADASEEQDLTLWEDMPADPSVWSPFRIQINNFQCGGLAIGLSCTHMHADLTSATLLFKSWTEFHRGLPLTHHPIFNFSATNGRSSRNDKAKSTELYAAKSAVETNPVKMGTATLRFSDSAIKKCLSQVHSEYTNVTPFDLLVALFWSRIARLKKPTDGDKHSLSFCVDLRKHTNKLVPFGYFGNALSFSSLSLDAKELLESDGVGNVSEHVHRHMASLENEFWSALDWFDTRKEEGAKLAPPFRMYGPELTCINMEHMIDLEGRSLMFDAMFKKGGKPVHVSYHLGNVEGEGLILVMPSPEEGFGRIVRVMLPEEQIGKLLEDEVILDLEPTVLLKGS
ncbi:HXXXD-type acyl-transferase family protein [Forsythia ovata]|uniref:HXXXD-type acyl-transferase family protein n=1 Tax=Forsythia ovata TaxID=205694 RepID=A0ABD1QPE7_9LAMI